MKKLNIFLIGLLTISLVSALAITSFDIADVTFGVEGEKAVTELDVINFDCGKQKGRFVNSTEPDGLYDEQDVLSAIRSNCSEAISNINIAGVKYRENKFGTKSFDEDFLKVDECQKDGNIWNTDLDGCYPKKDECERLDGTWNSEEESCKDGEEEVELTSAVNKEKTIKTVVSLAVAT